MSAPAPSVLLAAIDATWPAAGTRVCGPFRLRRGAGGGKRVSAATREGEDEPAAPEIAAAEAAMRDMGQAPLFMLRPGDEGLDATLGARGYARVDPVTAYAASAAEIAAHAPPGMKCFAVAEPMAIMREIWAAGGIGPKRLAVMERVRGPRCYLLARHEDRPAGVAFAAGAGDVAMLHALEVDSSFRRHGVARNILGRAAEWAQDAGAKWFSALTTGENLPASSLFAGIGMSPVAYYHYRLWIT